MTDQVIYSLVRVRRIFPPNREVIRDISLGFYYGAKIGVLGLNGAGKSTLLRIMAGVDNDYLGETQLSKGYTRGMLEQEPQLDADKTVKQVVEEAVEPIVDALRLFDEVSAKFAEPDADYDKLIEEQSRRETKPGFSRCQYRFRSLLLQRRLERSDNRETAHAGRPRRLVFLRARERAGDG